MNHYPSRFVKSMLTLGMLFLFAMTSVHAQELRFQKSHPISPQTEVKRTQPAVGTLDVVAVRVEFQPDTNRLTSGTGIFGPEGYDGLPYLANQKKTYIDPLPHNREYFEAHLEFAKNYFLKASDGKLSINYHVLPQVYRLDNPMEEYAPIGESFTLEKIAELMRDVWQKVDSEGGFDPLGMGLNPDSTAFIIFHAGVGRDIELTGTSLDITPFDLPSIFLKDDNIATLLDIPGFDGFEINNGAFKINNSMLLPRTESRRGEDIQGNEVVFPLSINGLLCASIGSYLGLPDLFNTENGQPAIGRFGLMDGAGFFAYNGLIPPEPSAWEKVFLGWETPFLISPDSTDIISLPAASLNQPNSIAKIELSSTEYFLIENRHRDPEAASPEDAKVTLTTRDPETGEYLQKTFTNFDEDFIYQASDFDSLLDRGTLVDVSNFDWSLPGGIDPGADEEIGGDDDRHLNGGILIWHIDEKVIEQGLLTGKVNADESLRGVDLEEADGAQDIGRDPGLLDNTPSFGFAYDFWWSGNNYRVETVNGTIDLNPDNIFGPNTFPNNNSNSGARSAFELYDFSDIAPVASVKIRPISSNEAGIEIIASTTLSTQNEFQTSDIQYWDYFPLTISAHEYTYGTNIVIPSNNRLLFLNKQAELVFAGSEISGTLTQPLPVQQYYTISYHLEGALTKYSFDHEEPAMSTIEADELDNLDAMFGFASSQDGINVDLDFNNISIHPQTETVVEPNTGYLFRSEIVNSKFVAINGNTISFVGESLPDYLTQAQYRLFAGTIQTNRHNFYYLFEDGKFTVVDPTQEEPFTFIFDEEKAEWPAIVNEGHIYRINRTNNTLEGYNFNGAMLKNTPIPAPEGFHFIGTPLIADVTGDNIQDILVVGQTDFSVNIFGYDEAGNLLEGFPLYVGGSTGANVQPIHPAIYDSVLYAVSHTGDFKAWRFNNFTSAQWPTRYGKNPYNKVSAYIEFSNTSNAGFEILNKEETYNWPNPADQETNIRYQIAAPGTIEITIIDYSGRVVFENTLASKGEFPEELPISTASWASGAYFARVKATVAGKSETKLIKIGVAH